MKKFIVKINPDLCIGCSSCVALVPDVFETIDGKTTVKSEYLNKVIENDQLYEMIKLAKESCPSFAIEVEEVA